MGYLLRPTDILLSGSISPNYVCQAQRPVDDVQQKKKKNTPFYFTNNWNRENYLWAKFLFTICQICGPFAYFVCQKKASHPVCAIFLMRQSWWNQPLVLQNSKLLMLFPIESHHLRLSRHLTDQVCFWLSKSLTCETFLQYCI